jgi:hypothetical protein
MVFLLSIEQFPAQGTDPDEGFAKGLGLESQLEKN